MNKRLVSFLLCSLFTTKALADAAPDFTQLIKQTKDAVVNIEVETRISAYGNKGNSYRGAPDIFEHFFGIPDPNFAQPYNSPRSGDYVQEGQGSGFIIDADGYLLTNAHVVEDADEVTVILNTQREYKAEVIGVDDTTDIALLKIDGEDLPVAKLGNSDDVEVGDWVLAMGSPFGFDYTATQGIVSATARSLPSGAYVPFIQTDAAINPGNSGGPLFNSKGEVIAINSQIYSRSGAFNGLAFSIPINMAKNIAEQLKTSGIVQRGWLGVMIQEVNQQLAESFDMDKPRGALVSEVIKESPAADAGLKAGDIILAFNGKEINKSSDLPPAVAVAPVGEEAAVLLLRNGKEQTIDVVIGDLNAASGTVNKAISPSGKWGMRLQNLTERERNRLELDDDVGVLIAEIEDNSAAELSELYVGDILLAIGGEKVNNVNDAREILNNASDRRPLPVLIYRDGKSEFLALVPQ